ncbi:hypothetical protein SNE40_021230 [Patella caerulea]|uniref:Uncharacterized protein n=1 Tax=Patella caerulea TaxID=87958 RepID=A0AAN8IXA7_PATCE
MGDLEIILIDLEKLKIGRCFKTKDFGQVQTAELHHFSEASTYGYGQCSYLRLVDENNNVSCSLFMSKSRVTPLKPITIPRLELSAALVSVKVSYQLRAELDYENVIESYWTDSKVVLCYINNDARRFHTFVANRISQIRDSTQPNQWHYVKSSENPADIASRGVTAHELLNSKWFSGPDFIWKPTVQASEEQIGTKVHEDDPEVKHVTPLTMHTQKTFELSRLNHIFIWKPTVQASEEQIGTKVHEDDPEVKHVTSLTMHTQKTFELSRLNHIFIWKPTVQASEEQIGTKVHEDDPEVKHVTSLTMHTQKTFELSRLNHISDWFHTKRSIALCLKLKAYLRRRHQTKDLKEPIYGPMSVEDLRKAEYEIIRLVQAEAVEDEIKIIQESSQSADGSVTKCLKRSSRLFKLDPFMDSNGILCVGGRLKISGYDVMDKHPMNSA